MTSRTKISGEDPVSSWSSEVKDFIYPTGTKGGVIGHYTQVVWAKSTRIGCGVSYCARPKDPTFKYETIVACRYWPGGNYIGWAPYVNRTENCNTCASMGYQCGTFVNNCSETVTCNSCDSSEKCVNNKCVPNKCKPKTKCDSKHECGTMLDGCGWYVDCAACPSDKTCNPNNFKCVNCTPKTSCYFTYKCGFEDDGCGGQVKCGECPKGYSCDMNIYDCVKNKSNKVGLGLGIFFAIVALIAIVVVVTIVLVKKGILVIGGEKGEKKSKSDGKSTKDKDMEMHAGEPEMKHQVPSSAPPPRPPKQAPPPAQEKRAPPPPPRGGGAGGRAPPPPPRR